MRSAHSRYLAGSRRAPITVVTFSFKNLLLDFQLLPLPLCNHFPKAHLCPTNLMRPGATKKLLPKFLASNSKVLQLLQIKKYQLRSNYKALLPQVQPH